MHVGDTVHRISDDKTMTITSLRPLSMWCIAIDEDMNPAYMPSCCVPNRYEMINESS